MSPGSLSRKPRMTTTSSTCEGRDHIRKAGEVTSAPDRSSSQGCRPAASTAGRFVPWSNGPWLEWGEFRFGRRPAGEGAMAALSGILH